MKKLTSFSTLLVLSLAFLTQYAKASTCSGASQCPTAVQNLQAFADRKVPEAQLLIGMLYRQGIYYPNDPQQAFKWIKRAARQEFNYAFAQHLFGRAYLYGEGVEVNLSRAERYLKRAAKLGLVDSQRILGAELSSGKILEQDLDEAKRWLRAAGEQKDFSSTMKLIQVLRRADSEEAQKEAEYWADRSKDMRVNIRDISERIELDLALIEKAVERSELWVNGDVDSDSACRDQNGDWVAWCGTDTINVELDRSNSKRPNYLSRILNQQQ